MAKKILWKGSDEVVVKYALKDGHGVDIDIEAIQEQIDDIVGIGRFLSLWNCSTGTATTNPPSSPYTYNTGDYFIVKVSGNRIPHGTSYTIGGTNYETAEQTYAVGDVFYFDGTVWQNLHYGSGGNVIDVEVNGTSVVENGVAKITQQAYKNLDFGGLRATAQTKSYVFDDYNDIYEMNYEQLNAMFGTNLTSSSAVNTVTLICGQKTSSYGTYVVFKWVYLKFQIRYGVLYQRGKVVDLSKDQLYGPSQTSSNIQIYTIHYNLANGGTDSVPDANRSIDPYSLATTFRDITTFSEIETPSSTTLTNAQINKIVIGCIMPNGFSALTGSSVPVTFMPAYEWSGPPYDAANGIIITNNRIKYYEINKNTKVITIGNLPSVDATMLRRNSSGYGIQIPDTTSWVSSKTLATTDQIPHLYRHSISITYGNSSDSNYLSIFANYYDDSSDAVANIIFLALAIKNKGTIVASGLVRQEVIPDVAVFGGNAVGLVATDTTFSVIVRRYESDTAATTGPVTLSTTPFVAATVSDTVTQIF